jgi:hypothetical protein
MTMQTNDIFKEEYQTNLSESTLKKAKSISKNIISENGNWLVQGSKGNVYEISIDPKTKLGLFCKLTNDNSACEGWKFHKECKHALAVRIFNGQTVKTGQ